MTFRPGGAEEISVAPLALSSRRNHGDRGEKSKRALVHGFRSPPAADSLHQWLHPRAPPGRRSGCLNHKIRHLKSAAPQQEAVTPWGLKNPWPHRPHVAPAPDGLGQRGALFRSSFGAKTKAVHPYP